MVPEFQSVTAQVIPVLFLAAAFESRWLAQEPDTYLEGADRSRIEGQRKPPEDLGRIRHASNISQSYGRIWLIILMLVGETSALHSIYAGSGPALSAALAIVGLLAGAIAAVFPLVALHAPDIRQHIRLDRGQWWWHGFIVLVLASP